MPATSIDQIFRFEDNLVAAAVAALNADSILGPVVNGNRPLEEAPKSRIEVDALGFAKASEQQVYAQSAYWDQHYAGSLVLRIRTQRGDTDQASRHSERVGRCRYLMTAKAQVFTTTNLPHYEILNVELASTRLDAADTTDADVTELTFNVQLALLASAFP